MLALANSFYLGGMTVAGSAGASEAYKVSQSVQGVQVYGAPLNIAAGDVHHHVHHHYAAPNTARFPPGWDQIENHRRIQVATLGRAARGTGTWVRQMGSWHIWLNPEGYLKIMWGYGIRTSDASCALQLLTPVCSGCWQDHSGVRTFRCNAANY